MRSLGLGSTTIDLGVLGVSLFAGFTGGAVELGAWEDRDLALPRVTLGDLLFLKKQRILEKRGGGGS